MKNQIEKIYKEIKELGKQFCDLYGFKFYILYYQRIWFKVEATKIELDRTSYVTDFVTMYVTFEDIEHIAASDLKDKHLRNYFRDAYYEQNTSGEHLPFVEWQSENKFTYQK